MAKVVNFFFFLESFIKLHSVYVSEKSMSTVTYVYDNFAPYTIKVWIDFIS